MWWIETRQVGKPVVMEEEREAEEREEEEREEEEFDCSGSTPRETSQTGKARVIAVEPWVLDPCDLHWRWFSVEVAASRTTAKLVLLSFDGLLQVRQICPVSDAEIELEKIWASS